MGAWRGYLGENENDVTGGVLFEGEGENPLKITESKKYYRKRKWIHLSLTPV